MPHITLVGDSILDNRAYVGSEPDVVSHLRRLVPRGWQATLCAVDGSTAARAYDQIERIPNETTHIIVSAGGNDALMNQNILYSQNESGAAILERLDRVTDQFGKDYHQVIQKICTLKKPLVLCTIYNANLPDNIASAARVAVSVFNDRIYSEAHSVGARVLDLRKVCKEKADYANTIEPSGIGGEKIARAILNLVGQMEKRAP